MTHNEDINTVLREMAEYEKQWDAQFAVDDETGTFLYELVLEHKPERILELGTWRGASAIYMGAALQKLGRGSVVTVDRGNDRTEQTAANLEKAGMIGTVEQVTEEIDNYLSKDETVYDFVFLDAAKKQQGRWFKTLLEKNARQGTIIVVDDVMTMGERMQDIVAFVENNEKLSAHTENISDGLLVIKVL